MYQSDSDEFQTNLQRAKKQDIFTIHTPNQMKDNISTPKSKKYKKLLNSYQSPDHLSPTTDKTKRSKQYISSNNTKKQNNDNNKYSVKQPKTTKSPLITKTFADEMNQQEQNISLNNKLSNIYKRCQQIQMDTKREKRSKFIKELLKMISDHLDMNNFGNSKIFASNTSDSCSDQNSVPEQKTSSKKMQKKSNKNQQIIKTKPKVQSKVRNQNTKKLSSVTQEKSQKKSGLNIQDSNNLLVIPLIMKRNQQELMQYFIDRIYSKIRRYDSNSQKQKIMQQQYVFFNKASKINLIKTNARETVKSILTHCLNNYMLHHMQSHLTIYIVTCMTNLSPQNLYLLQKGLKCCKHTVLILPTANHFESINFQIRRDYQIIPYRVFTNKDLFIEYFYMCLLDSKLCAYLPPQALQLIKQFDNFPISFAQGCRRIRYLICQLHILSERKGIQLEPVECKELMTLLDRSYFCRFSRFQFEEDTQMYITHIHCILSQVSKFELSQKITGKVDFLNSSDIDDQNKVGLSGKIKTFRLRLKDRFQKSENLKKYCCILSQYKNNSKEGTKNKNNNSQQKKIKGVKKIRKEQTVNKKSPKNSKKNKQKINKKVKKSRKSNKSKKRQQKKKNRQESQAQYLQNSQNSQNKQQMKQQSPSYLQKQTQNQQQLNFFNSQLERIIKQETVKIRKISNQFKWSQFHYIERIKPMLFLDTHNAIMNCQRLYPLYKSINQQGYLFMSQILYMFCYKQYFQVQDQLNQQRSKRYDDIFCEEEQMSKKQDYELVGFNTNVYSSRSTDIDRNLRQMCGKVIFELKQLIMYGIINMTGRKTNPKVTMEFYPLATYGAQKVNTANVFNGSNNRNKRR